MTTKKFVDNLVLEEHQVNPVFTRNLYLWTSFINNHEWEQRPFDYIILQLLSYCIEGRISRLMISIPPQHGKSTFITESFISYLLVHCPDEKVIISSYTQDLATEFGGNIKDIINYYGQYTEKKPTVRDDTKAKNKFKLERPHRGRVLAKGSGGGITGFEANVFVIDDPFKSFEDAFSKVIQDKVGNWYHAVVQMRLRKRSNGLPPIIILLAQRLNENDLHGQIKKTEPVLSAKEALQILKNGETINPDVWVDLNLTSICEDPSTDILGRKKGETLWPSHRDYNNLMALKRSVGSYIFETQMQGNPPKQGGYIFKPYMFYDETKNGEKVLNCTVPYTDVLKNYPCGRFWDLAAQNDKKVKVNMKEGDYYCGSYCAKDYLTDIMYVFSMERDKKLASDVLNLVRGTLLSDGIDMYTRIEQEGASHSLLFLTMLQEEFPEHDIEYTKPLQNKAVRSFELKRLAEYGLLKFVTYNDRSNDWIYTAVDELLSFDGEDSNSSKGKHDDITDSLSMAATYFKLNKNYYLSEV